MRFNIDISDVKEVAGSINVHGSIFAQTGFPILVKILFYVWILYYLYCCLFLFSYL